MTYDDYVQLTTPEGACYVRPIEVCYIGPVWGVSPHHVPQRVCVTSGGYTFAILDTAENLSRLRLFGDAP